MASRPRLSVAAASALILFGECRTSWAQLAAAGAFQSAASAAVPVPAVSVRLGPAPGSPAAALVGGLSLGGASLPSALAPAPSIMAPAGISSVSPAPAPAAVPRAVPYAQPTRAVEAGRPLAVREASAASLQAPAAQPRGAPRPAPAAGSGREKTAPTVLGSAQATVRSLAEESRREEPQAAGPRGSAALSTLYDGDSVQQAVASQVPPVVPGMELAGRSSPRLGPAQAPVDAAVRADLAAAANPVHAIVKNKTAQRALLATGIFKFGMEALNISMPIIALSYFGSAVWMATMAAAWGAAMTLGSSIGGGLVDRKPVQKVLAGAMALQSILVGGIIGAMTAGLTTPWVLLPLYAASGLAMGAILTARDTIPARILGRHHSVLSAFNATTHLVYEVAGTLAPILVGLLISRFGLAAGLFIHPPAYLLAAILFYRLKLDPAAEAQRQQLQQRQQQLAPVSPEGSLKGWRRVLRDIREGAKVVLGSSEFRWLGFILLLPMVVHRVSDQMLIPLFASSVLGAAQKAAWMISASNFGELLGAILLLRTLMDPDAKKTPYRWLRFMVVGLLGVWGFVFSPGFWPLLPAIFLTSMSWAANDLSMTAYFQSRLPPESAGKAVGFLMGAELGIIMTVSYLLGLLFDLVPAAWAFPAVAAAVTVLGAFFLLGRSRVRADYKRLHPDTPGPRVVQ